MENPKISIIIPVYNTEKYVKDAILSIMNQSIKDIEILVINDGSTDNSLQIIRELAKLDSRIRIFSQENKGSSIARNVGINKARGRYIYFMDSDDLLCKDALIKCYEKCVKNNLDFVFFDANILNEMESFSLSYNYIRSDMIEDKIYSGIDILIHLLETESYRAAVWLHFININFLKRINLIFYPGIIHEDELFSALLYIQAQKVGYIPIAFFSRRLREGSIMVQKYSYKNIEGYFTVLSHLCQYSHSQNKKIQTLIDKTIRYIINPVIYNARVLSLKERTRVLKICTYYYFKYIKLKNIIVLLFPFTVSIKSYLKKDLCRVAQNIHPHK